MPSTTTTPEVTARPTLDLTPFHNPAHRVDPTTLPALPGDMTIADLAITAADPQTDQDTAAALRSEAIVRRLGYLPVYSPTNDPTATGTATGTTTERDQFGYDHNGIDAEGNDRYGLPPEYSPLARPGKPSDALLPEDDPLLAIYDDQSRRMTRFYEIDRRVHNGTSNNKGNPKGQIIKSKDGRTLGEVWFDYFSHNEKLPPENRLEDHEIYDRIADLFPLRAEEATARKVEGRSDGGFRRVSLQRWRYNQGRLPGQNGMKPNPEYVSYRYIQRKDLRQTHRVTARGRLLAQWPWPWLASDAERKEGDKHRREQQPPHDNATATTTTTTTTTTRNP